MPFLIQKWIVRADLQRHPDRVYVFGDNVARRGYGGQAKEMRGEPNAIGVCTKRAPGVAARDFWTDATFTVNCGHIARDLALVEDALAAGKVVVFPMGGIGTGLARLERMAPKTFRYLSERLRDLRERYGSTEPE